MKRYKNIVFAIFVALTLVVSVIAPRIALADSNEISALAVDKYTREGRVPKSGVSKHFRCLKEVRLFPKI